MCLLSFCLFYQVDGLNSLHSVKATPNRFTKTSQGRSWNTGNGSPDAICLTVDKPGIVLVGVCVYGGGGIHEYELEVLADDVRDSHLVFLAEKELQMFHAVFSCNPPPHLVLDIPHRRKRSTQGTRRILTGGRPWSW